MILIYFYFFAFHQYIFYEVFQFKPTIKFRAAWLFPVIFTSFFNNRQLHHVLELIVYSLYIYLLL